MKQNTMTRLRYSFAVTLAMVAVALIPAPGTSGEYAALKGLQGVKKDILLLPSISYRPLLTCVQYQYTQ